MSRRSSASPDKPSTGRSRSSARRSGLGGAPVRRLWAMVIATLLISAGTLLWLSSRGTDAPAGGPSAAVVACSAPDGVSPCQAAGD